MGDKTLEQLDEQISSIKSKLQVQITELVDIIVNDLPDYALKHVRKAFIEDVEEAEKKSDAELKAFKARVTEFGQELKSDVRASLLEDMEIWWNSDVAVESAGKTLNGNQAVFSRLSVITERIREFIRNENLKAIEIEYHTPARFIDGKYPPGMIEKYWSQITILRAAEAERAELDREARKARAAERWDNL